MIKTVPQALRFKVRSWDDPVLATRGGEAMSSRTGAKLWRTVSKPGFGCTETVGSGARMDFPDVRALRRWPKCDSISFPKDISVLGRPGHRGLDKRTSPRSVNVRMTPLSNEKSVQMEADGIWREDKGKGVQCLASPRGLPATRAGEWESARPHGGRRHNA